MKAIAIAAVFFVAATVLAGCSSKDSSSSAAATTVTFDASKGAIRGIVIDDRYRPVPDAEVLLTQLGTTVTSDSEGQFGFGNLEPGAYLALTKSKDHEAAPKNIDIVPGQYTDVEIQARRIFSQDGSIITTQYSVFIDCAFEAVVVSAIQEKPSCTGDETGDSARANFDTTFPAADAKNLTYMITEFLFNKVGDYGVVVGVAPGGSYDTYYAEGNVVQGVYQRFENQPKVVDNRTGETANRNVKFNPAKPFSTTVFPHGQAYGELHGATRDFGTATGHPICVGDGGCEGVGVALGVKAKIVQTTFLGKPNVDPDTYAVLKPAAA